MGKNYTEAVHQLAVARQKMCDAEYAAQAALREILKPCGEHGCTVTALGEACGEFIVLAECSPMELKPVTLVRYWKDKLEVFVSEYEQRLGDWYVLPDGEWVDYTSAHTDTWFLLDVIEGNLEYADGYDDEED